MVLLVELLGLLDLLLSETGGFLCSFCVCHVLARASRSVETSQKGWQRRCLLREVVVVWVVWTDISIEAIWQLIQSERVVC